MGNRDGEVIKGRGPDGVRYSALTPQHKSKDAQKQHKLMAAEKIDAAAALLSAGLTPSPTPPGPSRLLLSEGMYVAAGAEGSTAVSASCLLTVMVKR